MTVSEENNRRIQDYLDGSMSVADRKEFEKECANDEQLTAELELFRTVYKELQDQEVRAFRRQIVASIEQQKLLEQSEVKETRSNGKRLTLLLLIVGLGGLIGFYINSSLKSDFSSPETEEQRVPQKEITPIDTLNSSSNIIASGDEEEMPRAEPQDGLRPDAAAGGSLSSIPKQQEKSSVYQQLAMAEFTASTFVFRGPSVNGQPEEAIASVFNYYAEASMESDSSRKQQSLEAVLALLDSMDVSGDERLLLTRAQVYFESAQYGPAASDFEALRSSFAYDQNADWGAMLCYLAQMPEQQKAFQQTMDRIIKNEKHDFRLKALALQEKVAQIE